MKLYELGSIAEKIFTDTVNVYRTVETVNADSTTSNKLSETPVIADANCRLSIVKLDSPTTEGDGNRIILVPKLFCSKSLEIKEGDYVVVTRLLDDGTTATYAGTLGLPFLYPTHKEVLMIKWGYA